MNKDKAKADREAKGEPTEQAEPTEAVAETTEKPKKARRSRAKELVTA